MNLAEEKYEQPDISDGSSSKRPGVTIDRSETSSFYNTTYSEDQRIDSYIKNLQREENSSPTYKSTEMH